MSAEPEGGKAKQLPKRMVMNPRRNRLRVIEMAQRNLLTKSCYILKSLLLATLYTIPIPSGAHAETEHEIKERIFETQKYQSDSLPFNTNNNINNTNNNSSNGNGNDATPAPQEVDVGVAFNSLATFDQIKSTFTLNVWLRQTWVDERLKWTRDGNGEEK
jgi:hypothetical protein